VLAAEAAKAGSGTAALHRAFNEVRRIVRVSAAVSSSSGSSGGGGGASGRPSAAGDLMGQAATALQASSGPSGSSGSAQGGRSLSFATPRPSARMLRAYSDGSAGALLGVDFDAGAAGEGALTPRQTLGAGAGAGAGAGGDTDPRSVAGAHSGISAARSSRALLARGASFNRRPTGSGGGVGGSGHPTARGSAAGRNSSSEAAIGVISIHGGDAGVGADGTVSCGSALTSTDGGAPVPYDAEADAADHAASACSPTRRIPATFALNVPCSRRACGCQPGPGSQASYPYS